MARWLRILVLALGAASSAGHAVTFDWVVVGDPGNLPDDEQMRCCEAKIGLEWWEATSGYGSVGLRYRIMRTQMPTWAYVEFLAAVARSDPNGLYAPSMGSHERGTLLRSGVNGVYTYAAKDGKEDEPVSFVDWYRAARFANWLHNGQPSGVQNATTTEDGAYTLLGQNPIQVPRNPGARYWIPSEDEWYKAAYHVPGGGYVDFGTGSDDEPVGEPPPGGPDSANFCPPESVVLGSPCEPEESNGPGVPTDVGAYPEARSPWGIQDAVGNLIELTEEHHCCDPSNGWWMAAARGGPYDKTLIDNAAYGRNFAPVECNGCWGLGFRIARLPPRFRCGLGAELAVALVGLRAWRARRAGRRREAG